MRDYERLIKNLRCCDFNGNCIYCDYMNDIEKCEAIEAEAADAIEELLKRPEMQDLPARLEVKE